MLRIALRVLWNSPGFTVVVVVTLTLGIAASTTVFGWVDAVLLRPIPGVPEARQLAVLEGVAPDGGRLGQFPHPDFRDFQRQMTLASGVAAAHMGFFTVGPVERPQRVLGQVVSANYFAVLGVKPMLGRMLQPEEDLDTQGAAPFAVISHRLWQTYLRGDPGVAGSVLRINGHPYTVVGVAPPDFAGTITGARLDVWIPLSMVLRAGMLNTWAAADRNARFLDLIVRLKPGVTIEQAGGQARAVAVRMAAAYPDTHKGIGAKLVPVSQSSTGLQSTLRNPLRILMAVCILVLLIACANVANLLTARAVARRREFGIRLALGAGRGPLIRQLLTEVLLLAGAGALLGLLLAQWLGDSLLYVLPTLDAPVRAAIQPILAPKPSGMVLLFTALAALGAALLSTIMPILQAGRVDVNEALREGGRGGTSGARSHRARNGLVIAEVALAAVALIGAGLSVQSFYRLSRLEPGFDPRNVLVAHLHLSTSGYSLQQEKNFNRELRLRLESAPGVDETSYGDSAPLAILGPSSDRVQVDGSEADVKGVTSIARSVVSPGYFHLMRIPILGGRDFSERDDLTSERVILVNQTFAKRYFGGANPIGRRVRVSGKPATIIGLVKDAKYRSPAEGPTPFFYGAFSQMFYSGHTNLVFLRSRDLDEARATLRREVAVLDRSSGLYDVATLTDYAEAGLFGERVASSLLSALGVLALALAAVGLYSVMADVVGERTQEIGIRIALGAQRWQVIFEVLAKGLAMTLTGLAAGMAGAVVCARILSTAMQAPVKLAEPAVFVVVVLTLMLTAFCASFVPARRATKSDSVSALRAE